jgi:hypothetical protein
MFTFYAVVFNVRRPLTFLEICLICLLNNPDLTILTPTFLPFCVKISQQTMLLLLYLTIFDVFYAFLATLHFKVSEIGNSVKFYAIRKNRYFPRKILRSRKPGGCD